ncbi:MAG: interleukin-like EMT inducer domain-containing protein [Litorilinea sp.]
MPGNRRSEHVPEHREKNARPSRTRTPDRAPRSGAILILYLLLSLVYTWPLARQLTTHMPGDGGDDPALAWNLWWIKHRLIDQVNLDFFHVDYMFYPIEINLAFYTLTPLNGLLSVPLQTGLSLLLANNLVLLSSFVLGGYGVYLLTRWLLIRYPLTPLYRGTGVTPIAIVAGIIYAFASSKLFYPALGQFNIASSHWIPFCALYLLQMAHAPTAAGRARAAALAGLFLVFQAWSELTYASFLIIFGLLLFGGWLLQILRTRHRAPTQGATRSQALGAWLTSGLIFGAVFAVGLAPFLAAMLPDLRAEGDFFGMGGGFADIFSADLMGYLFPTMLHPWWGEWASRLPFPNDKGQQIFVGYSVMALAAAGAWAAYTARKTQPTAARLGAFWIGAGALFFLLTLGPNLRWAGMDLPIIGPFEWVSRLPFFSGNRYPSRYGVMLMLCAAVLAAYGLAWLHARAPRWVRGRHTLAIVAVLLFSVEHLSLPLPLTDARIPSIYGTLARIPGDFAVLELPTGWRNGARIVGRADELIMLQQWYQTAHAKRRLGGNTSRNPQSKFQYFTDAPLIGDLIALMNADRDHLAAALEPELDALIAHHRPTAGQVLVDLGVRYVLLHTEPARSPPALQRFVQEALPLTLVGAWDGLDWTGQPAGIRLYAVDATVNATQPSSAQPSRARTIDLTAPAGNLYLAEGWSAHYTGAQPLRLAQRAQVDLLLPAHRAPTTYRLTLEPTLPPSTDFDVRWQGQPLTDWTLQGGELTITPPVATTMARLTLDFGPAPLAPTAWTDGATLDSSLPAINLPATNLLVRSAGEEVGDFAQIFVNGHDHAPNLIGYNLVALTSTGTVLETAAFDTHGDPAAGDALAHWLTQWPAGTLIAGAVADEASLNLNAAAVAALATVGSTVDLRGQFRSSHAFIGMVGAQPGQAREAVTLLTPAAVGHGIPQETPHIFGGVHTLHSQTRP